MKKNLNLKEKGTNKKEISKEEAEKILKEANKYDHDHSHGKKKETKKKSSVKSEKEKPASKKAKSKPVVKKTKKLAKSNLKLYSNESTYDNKIIRTYEQSCTNGR